MEKAKILIVEDEGIVAMALEDSLISMGHHVCGKVSSGKQALKSASLTLPNLVMMDIKIKGSMDGIETAKILKDEYNISVIFLTAYANKEVLARAKLTEPLGYLLKPFKPRELEYVIEVALYKENIEKKIRAMNQELEEKVKERTQSLIDEIAIRKSTEKQLHDKTDYLEQANNALKSILDNRNAEQRAIENGVLASVKKYALPYIDLIEQQNPNYEISMILDMFTKTIDELLAETSKTLFSKYIDLTPQEVKIADLIKHGKSTKTIADLLNIAPTSVSTYRNHIRKKMGLLNSSTNLGSYLNSLK